MNTKAAVAIAGTGLLAYAVDQYTGLSADIAFAGKLGAYRKQVEANFANDYLVADFWAWTVRDFRNKTAVIMIEDDGSTRSFTFEQMDLKSNQYANLLASRGIGKGDTVALFMENRPEFIIAWLGITKLGARVAMINTSIVQKGLTHCINISGAKAVVFGSELEAALAEIVTNLTGSLLLCQGKPAARIAQAEFMDDLASKQPTSAPPAEALKGIKHTDIFGYIYTSGTTGLPKAANIMHAKMFGFGGGMSAMFEITPSDVVYTCLPLFHSAGGGMGAGIMVIRGCTLVLRKKFSASQFFQDCAKHNVTVVQYIGELCRYLLATPHGPYDRKHSVRVAVGNGLRPEIWDEFQTRFNLPMIGEFYGSTEGNGALVNLCKTPAARGAVGRLGFLLKRMTGFKLARYDVENDCLMRGADGMCVECATGQPGELLMPIKPNDPSTQFAGYNDAKATEKKIVRNAFVKGDAYFSTGDLLSCDAKGYFRFVDRIGDTFRWKGENCSTTEVTEVISTFAGVEEANVVGVLIPNNQDGRAPMVAITEKPGSKVDLAGLLKHARKNLPPYAVPLFIRMTPAIAITATLKHQKVEVRNEGIDVNKVKDPLFYLDDKLNAYVPLTKEVYARITAPKARI